MDKPLIIVESPAKARTIEKFLGRRYQVKASLGHVRDLPRSQFGVEIERGFQPKYITIRGKGDVIKELRERARKAPEVLLATDPDREGEAISWHLAEVLGLDAEKPLRVEFHEITRDAIRKAIKKPRPISDQLVSAQQARRILDRLVGYKLSPLLWRKVRRGLSAGRVQSVAVRLIVDREQEIEAFVKEEYWSITATLETAPGENRFQARYHGQNGEKVELRNEAETNAVLDAVRGATYRVTDVKKKERRKFPAPPFTTSTLQQEASRKLGFPVRKTMSIAQQLYEGLDVGDEGRVGLVTYIRTDSTRVAESARKEARAYIQVRYGVGYLGYLPGTAAKGNKENKEGVQDAHEAIRPTAAGREPDQIRRYLTADQYRLYRLIWDRFVASQMAPAVLDTVSADIAAGEHLFRATGSALKFPGYMAIYSEGRDDEERDEEGLLPELATDQVLRLIDLEPRQHFTQPPPRYTEAMLVKALEEKRIGRPSTYAPIIDTIMQRGYVIREEKRFRPTELGRLVIDLLKEHFPRIIDVEFTAEMEEQLDEIEEGRRQWREVLGEFYGPFSRDLSAAEEEIGEVELPEEVTEELCEKCGRRMVIKHGRFGRFLACPGFPECRFTKPLLEEVGVVCPRCGRPIVERKSKKGRRFYGCSGYPECDFVTWYRPVKRECPECGAFLVQRRARGKGTYYACSRENCTYEEQAETDE